MHPLVAIAVAVTLGTATVAVEAQSWRTPADSQRCPSKWGAGDQRGSANHMKADTVLRAARLIVQPLKIQGGTGSTVAPFAAR
jgi:hypothetical protein